MTIPSPKLSEGDRVTTEMVEAATKVIQRRYLERFNDEKYQQEPGWDDWITERWVEDDHTWDRETARDVLQAALAAAARPPAPSVDDVVTITLNKKLAERIKRGAEKDAYYWTAVCDDSYADLRAIVDACEAALAVEPGQEEG